MKNQPKAARVTNHHQYAELPKLHLTRREGTADFTVKEVTLESTGYTWEEALVVGCIEHGRARKK